jgi:prevent-host-death family protein
LLLSQNPGGAVIDRVARGERLTITRDGKPVAELWPYVQSKVTAATLLTHWKHLPVIDPAALRDDLDATLDARI